MNKDHLSNKNDKPSQTNKRIHSLPHLRALRKELRNNLTPAEAFLWKFLNKSQINGLKFTRQHSINNYIVDFYCPKIKLIIELDGHHHTTTTGENLDEIRDTDLENLGFTVIRFENKFVFEHLETVLNTIKQFAN